MNAIRPVTREHHANKRWKSLSSYQFAANRAVAPLAGAEVAKAALALPLAFVEAAGAWSMVAVLGLAPGQNLFVAPNGRWTGGYIPAVFRGYPFQLAKTQNGHHTLCIDETSGLVAEGPEGTPFFDESGTPNERIQQVVNFLSKTAKSGEALSRTCAVLAQQSVIEPWPLTVKDGDQQRQVTGLHRINEAALNGLSDERFLAIRQAGGLPIAYAQLLSMANVSLLGRLAQAHARAQAQAAASQTLDLDQTFGLSDSATVDWGAVKWDE